MKRVIGKLLVFLGLRGLITGILQNVIRFLSELGQVNLLSIYYKQNGIMNPVEFKDSGELYFLEKVLCHYISGQHPVLFDVGANVGNYSEQLRRLYSHAEIHAFEPNPESCCILKLREEELKIKVVNLGLGRNDSDIVLYTEAGDHQSSCATMYREVYSSLYKNAYNITSIKELPAKIITLDNYCEQNNITRIDFLKIDTEGHELEVLQGARNMIDRNRITVIQFEFNEMNIVSRTFLRDFYELLTGFDLYRLAPDRLIPLFKYDVSNEIFKLQNIIALKKESNQIKHS